MGSLRSPWCLFHVFLFLLALALISGLVILVCIVCWPPKSRHCICWRITQQYSSSSSIASQLVSLLCTFPYYRELFPVFQFSTDSVHFRRSRCPTKTSSPTKTLFFSSDCTGKCFFRRALFIFVGLGVVFVGLDCFFVGLWFFSSDCTGKCCFRRTRLFFRRKETFQLTKMNFKELPRLTGVGQEKVTTDDWCDDDGE